MKERPILFSGAMVRALLAGTKTQTRRVVKPQPTANQGMVNAAYCGDRNLWLRDGPCDSSDPAKEWRCPYGKPGDRLWVRETWAEVPRHEPRTDEDLPWREDGRILVYAADPQWSGARQFLCADGVLRWAKPERWRPSIHMPRAASRITLEITSVRVERLQDISEADARAEGAPPSHPSIDRVSREFGFKDFPRSWYAQLWDEINGPDSWAANPWVWVISFKKVTP